MTETLRNKAGEIIALIPTYGDAGDCTRLILRDGSELVEQRSIKSCLKELWKIYSLDYMEYRREYQSQLGSINLLPWPLDTRRTFAPVKLRKPLFHKDAAYGYVATQYVAEVREVLKQGAAKATLLLKRGVSLTAYMKKNEILSHLQRASYLHQVFWGKRIDSQPDLHILAGITNWQLESRDISL